MEKWFDKKFDFSFEENIFQSIIDRLNSTADRLVKATNNLDEKTMELRLDNTWSVKENIGHLLDLEPLWKGRLQDILNGEEILRPADLENQKTDLANHNDRETIELLHEFKETRNDLMRRLEKLQEGDVYKSALHPRLKTPMRTMDLFLFVADHDDHHLERIAVIVQALKRVN